MQRKLSFGGIFLLFLLLCAIISCIHLDTTSTEETISTEDNFPSAENIISIEDTISTEDTNTWAEDTLICTAVIDGDTFKLKTGETVRLIGIDAPELSQPGGEESRQYLTHLILNKGISLEKGDEDRDKYNRLNLRWGEDIPVITWKDADKYYNQYVIVEGTIVSTFNSGNVCFLNFDTGYQYFTAVIFASDFLGFPFIPKDFYLGKKVYIIGIIKEYKGSPEIIVKTPGQIRIFSRNQHIFWKLL